MVRAWLAMNFTEAIPLCDIIYIHVIGNNIKTHKVKCYELVVWGKLKVKVSRNRPEQAQGVPSRLMPRIFLTFGTTWVVGRQPYTPAAFTPGEIPGTHFWRMSWLQGTWFRR
jgi:hypothetical protein